MLRCLSSKSLRIARQFNTKLLFMPVASRISPLFPSLEPKCQFPISIQRRYINIKNELKEVHCCTGCGVQLQYTKKEDYGFIPQDKLISCLENREKPICQRCHRLRYYGKVEQSEVPASLPKEIIRQIPFKKHSLILFVCDLMDLPGSIIPHLNELIRNKPMVVVVNKYDLLPVEKSEVAMKRWVYSLFKAHHINNIKEVFFVSSLQNIGVGNVLNYINYTRFKHVYLIGMTNSGKSSFLNQCISFTRSKVTVKTLLSLATDGIQMSKEAMIADDHFDIDYWAEADETPDETESPSLDSFTISPLPSTTLGVTAVKLQHAKFLLYDTPGICPSAHRVRLLTMMLSEEQNKVKLLFPRKKVIPTVFTLDPNHSVFVGALARIDYSAVENKNPLIGYSYSSLPIHVCKTENAEQLINKHAGRLFTPPYSEEQYLTTGGIQHQSDFHLKRVFNTPSEIKNTLQPNSFKKLNFTALLDISVGGFGWISFFTLGADNSYKRYNQIMAGTLGLNSVKGFELYPRPPLYTHIPEKKKKYRP